MPDQLISQSQTAIQSFHSASTQKVVMTINEKVWFYIRTSANPVSRNDIQRDLGLNVRQTGCAVWNLLKQGKIIVCGTKEDKITKREIELLKPNPNPEIIFKKVSDKQKIKEAKKKLDDFQDFDQFTKNQRDAFVTYINGLEWNTGLRTKCEDLLIAYDQMKERIRIVNAIINQ